MKSPFTFTKTVKEAAHATWPNRAIRRAIKYGRSLPTHWQIFFDRNPEFFKLVRSNRFAA